MDRRQFLTSSVTTDGSAPSLRDTLPEIPTFAGQNPILRLLAMTRIIIFAAQIVFAAHSVIAQSTNASLTGRITDSSKAVAPDAKVIAINTGTRVRYETVTNETGSYYVTNLPPGTYRIEIEKLGFKAVLKSDVILHVQDALEINFEMVLGSASESVTVRGGAPLLDTESSTMGTVVEQRKANELPLNGRNVFNLISLAPSVVPQGSAGGTPVGVNPFGWGNYQVNGSFGNESAEYLDGQPLNIGYINLPVVIPTQDSIQEFKVQTSNLGADWGKFSGGVINLSTKSGSNGLHGEAYEYLRNRVLNANDPFNKANEIKQGKPNKASAFTQNQFGANAGGPLIIPHVYDGKDKTFWFFSWEGFRLRQGASPVLTTVPTQAELGGDFSAAGIAPILDPCGGTVTTGVACPNYTGPATPFPGNKIPIGRQNLTSLALEKLWPAANLPCGGTDPVIGCKNNYAKSFGTGGNQNQVVGSLDHAITNNQHIFFRYTYWNVLDLPQDPLGTGLCLDRCAEKYDSTAPALGYNWTVTPNTIVGIPTSLSRFAYNRAPKNSGFDLTPIGWPAQYNAAIPSGARTPPTPCVFDFADNVMCSQGQSFITDRNTQWNLSPNITLVRGKHTVKLGFQLEIGRDNYAQTNVASGAFAFCGSGLPCFPGNGYAHFLLGYADNPSSVENHFFGQAVVPALVAGQQIYRGFYGDDTYHVTNKLTLNLGLRYDLQGPWSERFNRLSYFDPTATNWLANPSATAGLTNVPGLPGVAGDVFLVSPNSRNNIPLPKDNVAPRLGFAYSWDSKTVIRGGYGIFWIPNYVSFGLNPDHDFVNAATTSYTGTIDSLHPSSTINSPCLPQVVPPVGRTLGALGRSQYATQVVQNFTIADRFDHPAGYVQQWNLNIQRNLPHNFFVSAAYVGSKGTHLALYDSQIDGIGDNYLPSAATQCAAQVAATGKRCDATGVTLLQSVPNPFYDPTTKTAYALSGPTTTVR